MGEASKLVCIIRDLATLYRGEISRGDTTAFEQHADAALTPIREALKKCRACTSIPDHTMQLVIDALALLSPATAETQCSHEYLDMDGICRVCGQDCRGITVKYFPATAETEKPNV